MKERRASIEIPNNLCYTLRIKISCLEYRFPIKNYPESDIEFLKMVNNGLKNNDFCLRNPEYHAPKFWGFIPANITGTLCYAKKEEKGLVGDIRWRNWRIVNKFNQAA